MEQLRKAIRKVLLENYLTSEDLETVKSFMSEPKNKDSEKIDTSKAEVKAEKFAKTINDSGRIGTNVLEQSDKISSYMLEVLADAARSGGEYILPTTNEKIIVNKNNIIEGIKTYIYPVIDLDGLFKFISPLFPALTKQTLDSIYYKIARKKEGTLFSDYIIDLYSNVGKQLESYIKKPTGSFINYLRTPFLQVVYDTLGLKSNKLTTNKPFGGDEETRADILLPTSTISNKEDIKASEEEKRIKAEHSIAMLKANKEIYKILKNESRENSYNAKLWEYIGIGIDGKRLNNDGLVKLYLSGNMDPKMAIVFEKKMKVAASKLLGNLPDELVKNFKQQNPLSFDENENPIITKEMVEFTDKYGRKTVCPTCDNCNSKRVFLLMAKNIYDFFNDNPNRKERLQNALTDVGIKSDPIKYLNTQLSKIGREGGTNINKDKLNYINEEESNDFENFYDDLENEENLSFNQIYNLSRQKRIERERESSNLQEVRNKIKALLLKNYIK